MLLRAWDVTGSDVESVPAIINSYPVSCGQRAAGVPPPSARANNLSLRASFTVFSCSNIHRLLCKLAESFGIDCEASLKNGFFSMDNTISKSVFPAAMNEISMQLIKIMVSQLFN